MLFDRIDEVIDKMNTGKKINQLSQMTDKVKRLEEALKRVQMLQERILLKRNLLSQCHLDISESIEIKKNIVILNEIEEKIKDHEIETANALRDMNAELTREKNRLDEVWKEYVKENTTATQRSLVILGKVLKNQEIVGLVKQIKELQEQELNTESVQALQNILDQGKQVVASLNLTAELERFLAKVIRSQATFIDVTPEVLAWLKKYDLLGNLKIEFN